MKRKRIVGLLTAIVCLLPLITGVFGLGEVSQAAIDTVDVTLHKKKMDDFPVGKKNTGEIDTDFNKYEGLKGVEFTPWDVTDAFYDMLKAAGVTGSATDEAYQAKVKEVMENAKATDFDGLNSKNQNKKQPVPGVGADSTDDNGEVTFANLPERDADGVYKVYWFEETANPNNTQFSQLVLLTLPVQKVDKSGPNRDIHLYPKNKLSNKPVKELLNESGTAETGTGNISYDIGKEIKYKVTYQIPYHIGEVIENGDGTKQTRYSKLVFKDAVSHDGVQFAGFDSMKVIGGTPENILAEIDTTSSAVAVTQKFNDSANYAATGQKAGFEIAMKLDDVKDSDESQATAAWLGKYAGKTLEIIYTVKLTEDTPVDQAIDNSFYVDLGQSGDTDSTKLEPEVGPPSIITGGKKFLKHEAGDETKTLKGAEFVITNQAGDKYLKGDANNYTWEDIVDEKYQGAIKITSGDNGVFEIKGLKYGTYQLVETKSPDGYKLGGPVEFIVSADSYSVIEAMRTKIPNISRGGFLPSTGGTGIIAFLVVGLALMLGAFIKYRRIQQAAN